MKAAVAAFAAAAVVFGYALTAGMPGFRPLEGAGLSIGTTGGPRVIQLPEPSGEPRDSGSGDQAPGDGSFDVPPILAPVVPTGVAQADPSTTAPDPDARPGDTRNNPRPGPDRGPGGRPGEGPGGRPGEGPGGPGAGPPSPGLVPVPNLAGLEADAARVTLNDARLQLGVVTLQRSFLPRETVLLQIPSAGEEVRLGARVHLVVSDGVGHKPGTDPPDNPVPPRGPHDCRSSWRDRDCSEDGDRDHDDDDDDKGHHGRNDDDDDEGGSGEGHDGDDDDGDDDEGGEDGAAVPEPEAAPPPEDAAENAASGEEPDSTPKEDDAADQSVEERDDQGDAQADGGSTGG